MEVNQIATVEWALTQVNNNNKLIRVLIISLILSRWRHQTQTKDRAQMQTLVGVEMELNARVKEEIKQKMLVREVWSRVRDYNHITCLNSNYHIKHQQVIISLRTLDFVCLQMKKLKDN